MLNFIITWALNNRLIVVLLAVLLIISGYFSFKKLPFDAFPDTTPIQVQINTVAPSLAPFEIEQQITIPIEQSISGLPKLLEVRSISKLGLSQITVVFHDKVPVYFARQLIAERLSEVELPSGVERPKMGPVATGLGEVFHYAVTSKNKTLEEITTIHDWVIQPRLASIPGVAEVNTWGGECKQYHVLIDTAKLIKYDLVLDQVLSALQSNNLNVGGGVISRAGELQIVMGLGLTSNIKEVESIVIKSYQGVLVKIQDVAEVKIGHEIRRGACTINGQGEAVLGLGFMLMGENSYEVTNRLNNSMIEIQKTLPEGVTVKTVYKRTDLVDQVIGTVKKNLFEGAILVIAVLFMFLGSFRAGLIVALVIPLSLIFAFHEMLQIGIAGSLMSLGAIDFGLIVDSSVIMVENSVRHLAENKGRRSVSDVVRDASIEVRKPTMFGELIIMIVFLPILTLEGIEGKLFIPMALTVIFALSGSLIMSLTLMPVLASLFLPKKISENENIIVRSVKYLYLPVLQVAIRLRYYFILFAIVIMGVCCWLSTQLGAAFIPRLSEMGIVINTVRLAGVSLDESVRYGTQIEKIILKKFPHEVADVWTRTGTAEVATDPMGIELSDVFITLRPIKEWVKAKSQQELTEQIRKELSVMPGMRLVYTQPIEMRVNEMIAGIRTDLGIKVFGDDLNILKKKADQIALILKATKGSDDVYVEQLTGQPMLEIKVDKEAIARYGVSTKEVLAIVEAIGEIKVGEVREDQKRFDLVVRLKESSIKDAESVKLILVPTSNGQRLLLGQLTTITQKEGPTTITRESQKRRIVVQSNVTNRDIASFVSEVKEKIEKRVEIPPGYYVAFGGQFEHLEKSKSRLMIVVPLALSLILILLFFSTKSISDTLLIFTGAPFAAVGGVLILWIFKMPFTVSAGIGFIAVSGVSMLNGLMMISAIRQMLAGGMPMIQAVEKGVMMRLRPIMMTALVASLGFVPMALNTGVGAEVQRPLALVVIGGIVSNLILTMLMLPAIFLIFTKNPLEQNKKNIVEGEGSI